MNVALRGSLLSDPNMLASTSSSTSSNTTPKTTTFRRTTTTTTCSCFTGKDWSPSSVLLSGNRSLSLLHNVQKPGRFAGRARFGKKDAKPRATSEGDEEEATTAAPNNNTNNTFDRDLNKFVKKTATTFAPSSSVEAKKKKNSATKGTALYAVFEVQAYLAIVVGGLLAFNVIYPSEEPTIARLMGMWSVWMFTVPLLRARDCGAKEKDALNLLFIAIPLVNVLIPFVWKSFAGVFTADVLLMLGVYYSKNAPPFGEEDATAAEPSE